MLADDRRLQQVYVHRQRRRQAVTIAHDVLVPGVTAQFAFDVLAVHLIIREFVRIQISQSAAATMHHSEHMAHFVGKI